MNYFTIKEFECRCWCGMPTDVAQSIEALVSQVLDPDRSLFGKPIKVNSGYRCAKHNAEIGGAVHSLHIKGEAADICAESRGYASMMDWKQANMEIARLIVKVGTFDQLILENAGAKDLCPQWVHVSYKRGGGNRGQILKKVAGQKGYFTLTPGEMAELLNK